MSKEKEEYKALTQVEILETSMGVYDRFQANLVNGEWEKKGAKLQSTTKVREGFTKNHNHNFNGTGSFYVLNKKKDGQYQKAAKEKRAAMADKVTTED